MKVCKTCIAKITLKEFKDKLAVYKDILDKESAPFDEAEEPPPPSVPTLNDIFPGY